MKGSYNNDSNWWYWKQTIPVSNQKTRIEENNNAKKTSITENREIDTIAKAFTMKNVMTILGL